MVGILLARSRAKWLLSNHKVALQHWSKTLGSWWNTCGEDPKRWKFWIRMSVEQLVYDWKGVGGYTASAAIFSGIPRVRCGLRLCAQLSRIKAHKAQDLKQVFFSFKLDVLFDSFFCLIHPFGILVMILHATFRVNLQVLLDQLMIARSFLHYPPQDFLMPRCFTSE